MSRRQRKQWAALPKDTVVLHQFPRGKITPSISPFCLKLETYLRVAAIPYENHLDMATGPKGKMPWITLNGEDYSDSQLCIELLAKKFDKANHLSSHLSESEQATATAFRVMAEEHLFWALEMQLVYTKGRHFEDIQSGLPWFINVVRPFVIRRMRNQAVAQGMGRHTQAEVNEMGAKDLRAISAYLAEKPFFTGQKATEVDCALFGILAVLLWNSPPGSPFGKIIKEELANLKSFCERMKTTFWPDWDRCLNPSPAPAPSPSP